MDLTDAEGSDRRLRCLRWSILGGYGLTVLLVVLSAVGFGLRDRSSRLDEASARDETLVRSLEEHARRTFGAIDLLLHVVATDIASAQSGQTAQNPSLQPLLDRRSGSLPQVRALVAYDSALQLRTAAPAEGAVALSLALQPQLVELRNAAGSGLRVGQPLPGGPGAPLTHAVPVARPVLSERGAFLGLVVALIDPEHFDRFYRNCNCPRRRTSW
jgi:hypothetical protein